MSIWDCDGGTFLDELFKSGGLIERKNRNPRTQKKCACGNPIQTRSERCQLCRRKHLSQASARRWEDLVDSTGRRAGECTKCGGATADGRSIRCRDCYKNGTQKKASAATAGFR